MNCACNLTLAGRVFRIIVYFAYFYVFNLLFIYADPPMATTIDGKSFSGAIESIDAKGVDFVQSSGVKRQLPIGELVVWGYCREPKRPPIIVFADGGFLSADLVTSEKERVWADTEIFGAIKIPLDSLSGMVFRLPGSQKERDALFDRIVGSDADTDRLVLDNADELAGFVEKIGEDAVMLKTNSGQRSVEIGQVAAIIFNPSLRSKTSAVGGKTLLGFSDGGLILASGVRMEAANLQFSAYGESLKTASKNLVYFQPLSGRAVYLSDLKPGEYHFVPYLDIDWPYCLDRTVTCGRLRAGGACYVKGIGMHSAAQLSYALDRPYKSFQAELAVDDSTDGGGSVRFCVYANGKEKFTSGIIRGGMKPTPIDIDISGVTELSLIIDYADRADVLDHADWLNARLIK
jgi:hypothetical protein